MLAEIRKQKGLSQSQLAKLSGVSVRMIQQYEQGIKDINKANADTIYHLTQALNCKMEDLIMKTVNIYKVTCTKGYQMSEQGYGYSLNSWGKNNEDYEGYDDGGQYYLVPEGYTVEMGQDEQMHFYNKKGSYVELMNYKGRPALAEDDNPRFLKKETNTIIEKEKENNTMKIKRTFEEFLKIIHNMTYADYLELNEYQKKALDIEYRDSHK